MHLKFIRGMRVILMLAFAMSVSGSAAPKDLPEDRDMQIFVAQILEATDLRNEVHVVLDPGAKGCAYATTRSGTQYIGVDPRCVGPLRKNGVYEWRAVGVLTHEIGHLLSGHTTNQKEDNPSEESDADEWSGWAMYRLGATLEEAQVCMKSMDEQGSKTHPGRGARVASVARGWNKAASSWAAGPPARLNGNWWAQIMKTPLPWAGR